MPSGNFTQGKSYNCNRRLSLPFDRPKFIHRSSTAQIEFTTLQHRSTAPLPSLFGTTGLVAKLLTTLIRGKCEDELFGTNHLKNPIFTYRTLVYIRF